MFDSSDLESAGALSGVVVLDVGMLIQGPQAAALLSDMGADVIKVELPEVGDQARWVPISGTDSRSAYFEACNRGKRSITLDLRTDGGREAFLRLVARSDVVISNFRPGTIERWELGYDVLSAVNPRVICAAGSAFGPTGADAAREGADLSGQAAGGLISTTGLDDGEPTPVGAAIGDHLGAQSIAIGVLAGLVARQRTGRGQVIESSLLGSQIWAQASEYTYYLLTGRVPGRANRSNPLVSALTGIFPASDGWIAIAGVPGPRRRAFFEAIGHPELAGEPRFDAVHLASGDKRELFAVIDAALRRHSRGYWEKVFREVGVRYAAVRDYAEVVADDQAWVNGYFARPPGYPDGADAVVGTPIRFSDTPSRPGTKAPELGQHTEEILLELGYTWPDIASLRTAGAI
jgi:crotonobetainyl-CoA:carnitine CoA-transferase CaiB-like acyl-CoA transferase